MVRVTRQQKYFCQDLETRVTRLKLAGKLHLQSFVLSEFRVQQNNHVICNKVILYLII